MEISWKNADVYYLEPQKIQPNENAIQFASRVKAMISEKVYFDWNKVARSIHADFFFLDPPPPYIYIILIIPRLVLRMWSSMAIWNISSPVSVM